MPTFLAANPGLQESTLFEAMLNTHEPPHEAAASMYVDLVWHIRTEGDTRIVEHHGATGACWSFAGFVKDARAGVVVLANTFHNIDKIGLALLRHAAAEFESGGWDGNDG